METSKKLAYITIGLFVVSVLFILLYILVFNIPVEFADKAIEVLQIVATPVSIILTGYFGKALVENYKKIAVTGQCDTSTIDNTETEEKFN